MTAHLYAQLAKNFSDRSKVAFEQPNGVIQTYADAEVGVMTEVSQKRTLSENKLSIR